MTLAFFVLTQYRRVADRRTDRRTGDSIYALYHYVVARKNEGMTNGESDDN